MSHIGKESRIVELIHKRTKVKKEDIYDVLFVLPEVFADYFVEQAPPENTAIHLGVINAKWQKAVSGTPGIVFTPTERFKTRFAHLKLAQKTPFAQMLYNQLTTFVKDRMKNKKHSKTT